MAVVIMLFGGIIPVAMFTAPALASICLVPILMELGTKTALLSYLAISIISLLLVPDREMLLFFVFLLGYYPMLQPQIQKIPLRWLRPVAKIFLCTLAVAATYSMLLFVFASPEIRQELAQEAFWLKGAMLLAGYVTFLLYDRLVVSVKLIYLYKFKGKLIK